MSQVQITCYSDVLCVWAYIAEFRLRHLREKMGDKVALSCRYFSVFGDTRQKFGIGWKDKGGFEGYAKHVRDVASRFPEISVAPQVWRDVRPASSMPAHLALKAVALAVAAGEAPEGAGERLAWSLRHAFFHDARDIGRRHVIAEICSELDLDLAPIQQRLEDGSAFASVATDQQEADAAKIKGSPSLVLNEGRQMLYGNVGYHLIEANVLELLREPHAGEASWC